MTPIIVALLAGLAYPFASFGLTFMIQYATIFDRPRNLLRGGEDNEERNPVQGFFYELFDCAFCVGTWSGLVLGGAGLLALQELGSSPTPVLCVLLVVASALASSTIGFIGYLVTQRLL
jgi:hypothetical protein